MGQAARNNPRAFEGAKTPDDVASARLRSFIEGFSTREHYEAYLAKFPEDKQAEVRAMTEPMLRLPDPVEPDPDDKPTEIQAPSEAPTIQRLDLAPILAEFSQRFGKHLQGQTFELVGLADMADPETLHVDVKFADNTVEAIEIDAAAKTLANHVRFHNYQYFAVPPVVDHPGVDFSRAANAQAGVAIRVICQYHLFEAIDLMAAQAVLKFEVMVSKSLRVSA